MGAKSSSSPTWFGGLFSPKPKADEAKPDTPADKDSAKPTDGQSAKPLDKESAKQLEAMQRRKPEADGLSVRAREEAALLRRLAVCDQLKLIAVRTKDDALLNQADHLEEQAQAVYARRIASLPASRAGAEPVAQVRERAPAKASGKDRPAAAKVEEEKP
jgi:hypothetical protein